jgi:hypothetical protein
MPQAPASETVRSSRQVEPEFLICLNLPESDWDDAWELCRGIEQCGGHRTEEGFWFCSAEERTLALEILQDRFGRQYFVLCDAPAGSDAAHSSCC